MTVRSPLHVSGEQATPVEPAIIRRGRGARGSADALGVALLAGVAIALALVILALGRRVDARATANNAAEAAAQAAALERTPDDARARAQLVAAAMLTDATSCAAPMVVVDTRSFRPGGSLAVTVSCTATHDGLQLPVGASQTYSTTAFATIDPLRAVRVQR